MNEIFVERPVSRPPTHPGQILREDVLPAVGLSASEAARRMGISRQQLHRVLTGKQPISAEMALRIGKFTGNGPNLWLRMQSAYNVWHIQRRMKDELARIEAAAPRAAGGAGPL